MGALRWGILSAGKISHDFACASAALSPSDHQIVAVAARSLESAQAFAKTFNIPKAYGSYEEAVRDPDIDVLYIGSIHPQHFPLGKLALENGKHVLCEKPLCMNVKETKALVELAQSKGLFLMEAIWSRFLPVYIRLKEEIDKGTIGEVLQVFASFSVEIAEIDRAKLKELGGGGILDIGIYCVQFALWVFDGERPTKIISGGHLNAHGVDECCSTTLIFEGGRTATLICHTRVTMENQAIAVGSKGTLKLEVPFWSSTKLTLPSGEQVDFPLPVADKTTNFINSMGLHYQCHEVARCINAGLKESPILSHQDTLLIAEIMESMRKQIGVVYLQD